MTSETNRLAVYPRTLIAWSMAWAAGYIDVVCWMVLYHVYVSHMTGNTASFAHDLGGGRWREAVHHGWPILPFICGLLYSAAITKAARRRGFHSSFSIALTTELIVLMAFVFLGSRHIQNGAITAPAGWLTYVLLSLPAAAMGMQTVTVTNINGLRVYTTYLTGSLAKLSEGIVDYGFWFHDRVRHHGSHRLKRVLLVSHRQKPLQHAALTAGLWSAFFAGALCGAITDRRFALYSLLAPMGVLVAAVIVDIAVPVAAADEPAAHDSAH